MSQLRNIAHNSVALLLSNVGNKLIGFLIMLSVARFLGADNFGLYTYVFAYAGMFALATDLGLTTVVIRHIAQDEAAGRRGLGNALILRWIVTLAAYALSVGGAFLIYGRKEQTWLIALSSLSFLSAPLATYTAIFSARMKQYGPALVSLASRLVLLLAVQWLARHGGTVAALIAVEVTLGTISSMALWLWSRSLLQPVYDFSQSVAWKLLAEGIPLFLTSVFVALYFRIDVFFLKYFYDEATIGIYAAAYRLTEAMPIVASALANSLFPVFCRQINEKNDAALTRLVRSSLKILLVVIVPAALVIAFYSKPVTRILYGGRYQESAPLLAILVLGQVLVYTNILFTTLLVARGESRTFMFLTLAMLALNIILNYLIIPQYGAIGAATTTVITELAGTIGCLFLTSSLHIFAHAAFRLLIPASTCAVMLGLFAPRGASWNILSLWPLLALAILYPACLLLFHVFDKEEWERLRRLAW